VVAELKIGKFEPGYAGQPGFYVALGIDRRSAPVDALICRRWGSIGH